MGEGAGVSTAGVGDGAAGFAVTVAGAGIAMMGAFAFFFYPRVQSLALITSSNSSRFTERYISVMATLEWPSPSRTMSILWPLFS